MPVANGRFPANGREKESNRAVKEVKCGKLAI